MSATEPRGSAWSVGIAAIIAVVVVSGPASATTIEPVLDDPTVVEHGAAASSGHLVWTSSVVVGSEPEFGFDLLEPRSYLMVGHGPGIQISERYSPSVSIDGTTVVFEKVFFGQNHGWDHHDLRMYDVLTGDVSLPPDGVNTREWEEVQPSISGDWLLFTRHTHFDKELPRYQVVLFNLTTGEERVIAEHRIRNLWAGQVNGDWATWESCDSVFEGDDGGGVFTAVNCQVHRYQISTGEKEGISNPGVQQWGAAVSDDGTVYLVRGGRRDEWRCGVNNKIVRLLPDGTSDVIASFPDGIGSAELFAFEEADGSTTLYLDRFDCESHSGGIYRMEVPAEEVSTVGRVES